MQKAELLRAAQEVYDLLERGGARHRNLLRPDVARWAREFRLLGDSAVELFDGLGLSMVIDQSVLEALKAGHDNNPAQIAADRLLRAVDLSRYLIEKLTPTGIGGEGFEIVRVTFTSHDGAQVDRVASMLTVTRDLYEVAREILAAEGDVDAQRPHELRVVAIDSGSDFSFDALGLAKIAEVLKDIIFGIWDRIRTAKSAAHQLETEKIAAGLSAIHRIHELKLSGALTPERSGQLEAMLVQRIEDVLAGGFHVDEGKERPTIRQIAAGHQKLLAAPPATDEAEDDDLIEVHPADESESEGEGGGGQLMG